MANRGAVHKFNHGMDDGLRVHGHVDAFRRHVEQAGRLDDFEALVHQCGGVDGDNRPHVPRRMMQRLLGSDVLHVGTFPAAERSAGGGDHKLGDFGVGSGAQGLPDGGMLGIDRVDLVLAHLRAEQQMPARDYGLLVGQCQLGTGLERRDRRFEADGAGDAVQYDIRTGAGHGDDRIRTAGHADTLCAGLCESCLQRWNLGLIKHRGFGHMELCGLLRQQLDMCSARRQTGDGKSFRMTRDDVKSLGADGSGGSENDDSGVGGYAHCSFFVSSLFSVGNDRSGISESKLPPSGNSSGNESLESCLSCDG